MNILFKFPFVLVVFAMVGMLVSGIYLACRERTPSTNDTLREALIWGGGFVVYAVFDYFILMR